MRLMGRRFVLVCIALLIVTLASASCTRDATSGVRGDLVYIGGPPPVSASAASPHLEPGSVTVFDTGGKQVASASFEEGRGFSIVLPPGSYRLVPHSGDAQCVPRPVSVEPDAITTIRVSCDVR